MDHLKWFRLQIMFHKILALSSHFVLCPQFFLHCMMFIVLAEETKKNWKLIKSTDRPTTHRLAFLSLSWNAEFAQFTMLCSQLRHRLFLIRRDRTWMYNEQWTCIFCLLHLLQLGPKKQHWWEKIWMIFFNVVIIISFTAVFIVIIVSFTNVLIWRRKDAPGRGIRFCPCRTYGTWLKEKLF